VLIPFNLFLVFRLHGGIQLTMPVLEDGEKLESAQYPSLFRTLLTALLKIFKGEQKRTQDSAKEVVPELIREFIAYAYNQEPFRGQPWTHETKPLSWWTSLSRDSNARLLAVSVF
jgi:hypothetical protein